MVMCIFVFMIHQRSIEIKMREFAGAAFGVILGFLAAMMRESIKDFAQRETDRKIYLKLLKEDAKSIHRTMWLYTGLINASSVPDDVKNHIPAEFDCRYWVSLSKNKEFLRFGCDDPFANIFKEMWEIEKINDTIRQAKTGDRQSAQIAVVMYKIMSKERSTSTTLTK